MTQKKCNPKCIHIQCGINCEPKEPGCDYEKPRPDDPKTEAPTEPGKYKIQLEVDVDYTRDFDSRKGYMVSVLSFQFAGYDIDIDEVDEDYGIQWQGPIPEPEGG
jgi:hypothetical protein